MIFITYKKPRKINSIWKLLNGNDTNLTPEKLCGLYKKVQGKDVETYLNTVI